MRYACSWLGSFFRSAAPAIASPTIFPSASHTPISTSNASEPLDDSAPAGVFNKAVNSAAAVLSRSPAFSGKRIRTSARFTNVLPSIWIRLGRGINHCNHRDCSPGASGAA